MTIFERENYLANPVLSLYEGDDGGDFGGAPAIEAPPVVPSLGLGTNSDDPNAPIVVDPNARFDQEMVNKIVQDRLAKDRKKHEERYKQLETSHQDLLANEALSTEGRKALEQSLENLQRQHRTKEEQAKIEKNQLKLDYETELAQYKEAATRWERQHKDYMIEKSLIDAAVAHDAFRPDQIFKIVREWTKLVDAVDESGKPTGQLTPMVDLPDVDADTGKAIITQRTPMEAIERLQELQGNLFKANVVSGVGGNSATGGVQPGATGQFVDQKELTTAQWMKIYQEDPTKLGIKPRKRY